MDLIQSTVVSVPIPIPRYQAAGVILLPDPGAIGTQYRVSIQEGISNPGGGVVNINTPYPGITQVTLAGGDFVERGTITITLEDVANNFVAQGQIDGGWNSTGLGIGAALVDSSGTATNLLTTTSGATIRAAVTALATATLGPYALYALDHAGNLLGSVYGRIVAAGSGGLTQADVRTALGFAAANFDTQIGNVLTAIATRAQPGDAMTLTAGERAAISNALLDLASAVETGLTPREALRLLSSVLGGVVQQTAPGVWQFLGAGVATARVIASIPGDGSRPSMTLNL